MQKYFWDEAEEAMNITCDSPVGYKSESDFNHVQSQAV